MAEEEERLAPTLTNAQRGVARRVLQHVRDEVERFSEGDLDLEFAIRRYVYKRLQGDERGAREKRETFRRRLFDRQQGRCVFCQESFAQIAGAETHRTKSGRYSEANTVLVHRECHQEHHLREGTAPEEG